MLVVDLFNRWWAYFSYCFASDYTTIVCRQYWNWVSIGACVLAGVILLLVGRSVLREFLEYRRNRLHLEARKVVASDELMESVKWRGGE